MTGGVNEWVNDWMKQWTKKELIDALNEWVNAKKNWK